MHALIARSCVIVALLTAGMAGHAYARDYAPFTGSIRVFLNTKANIVTLPTKTFSDIMTIALQKFPGHLLKIELETEQGFLVYSVEIVQSSGGVVEAIFDAGDGKYLGTEIDD